nr:retrovirus-related Pol polyprotein from transposon TNT 1-94 [Tanacetum cinerariifolium]
DPVAKGSGPKDSVDQTSIGDVGNVSFVHSNPMDSTTYANTGMEFQFDAAIGIGVVSTWVEGGIIESVVSGIVVGIVPNKITRLVDVPMLSSDESEETEIIEIAMTCTSKNHIPPLPATSPFLSLIDDSSDSDIPDTPPLPTRAYPSSSSETSSDSFADALSDSASSRSSSDHSLPAPSSGMRPSHYLCSLVPSIHRSSTAISARPSHDSSSANPSRKRSRSPAASIPLSLPIPGALSYTCADHLPSPKRIRSSEIATNLEDCLEDRFEPYVPRGTDLEMDVDVVRSDGIEIDHEIHAQNRYLVVPFQNLMSSSEPSPSCTPSKVEVPNVLPKVELRKLKGKALVNNVVTTHNIAPGMLKIDVEPVAPRLLDNRTAHSNYLRLTQEQAVILKEVVEQGKFQNPLNNSLDTAFRHSLVRGLPKLKFEKDHLCSACAMGKSKKKPYKPTSKDTNKEKLRLLFMNLCGLMRVASVNGKNYILVIVDDYSRFTWVKCLRLKDEALDFITKFLKMI